MRTLKPIQSFSATAAILSLAACSGVLELTRFGEQIRNLRIKLIGSERSRGAHYRVGISGRQ
jgi:hypothetical protein